MMLVSLLACVSNCFFIYWRNIKIILKGSQHSRCVMHGEKRQGILEEGRGKFNCLGVFSGSWKGMGKPQWGKKKYYCISIAMSFYRSWEQHYYSRKKRPHFFPLPFDLGFCEPSAPCFNGLF